MSRLLKLAIVGLVASCGGGGNYSAPRQLDNACAIVAERPAYYRAMKASERRWGIPIHVQMAAIHQESKFIGDARTPHQAVVTAMDALGQLGFRQISIATAPDAATR